MAANPRHEFYAKDDDVANTVPHHSTQTLVYDDHIKLGQPDLQDIGEDIDPRRYSAQTTLTTPITTATTINLTANGPKQTNPTQINWRTNSIPTFWYSAANPDADIKTDYNEFNAVCSNHWQWRQAYQNYTITAAELEIALIFRPWDSFDKLWNTTQQAQYGWGNPANANLRNLNVPAPSGRPGPHQPAEDYRQYTYIYGSLDQWQNDYYPYEGMHTWWSKDYQWDTPLSTTLSAWSTNNSADYIQKQPLYYGAAYSARAPLKVLTIAPNDTNIGIIRKRTLQSTTTWPDWQERMAYSCGASCCVDRTIYDYRNKGAKTNAFTYNATEYNAAAAGTTTPRNNQLQIWHHNLYCNHKTITSDTNYVDQKENIGTCDWMDDNKTRYNGTAPTETINMTMTIEQPPGTSIETPTWSYWDGTSTIASSHYIDVMIVGRLTQWITYFNPRPRGMTADIPVI